jgi:C-terminal processing protease CtpA/Prc
VPLCCIFFITGISSQAITPSIAAEQKPQNEIRIQRIAGLGKAWSAAKFLHPRLAWEGIDWDQSLIETIPKVNAAHDANEYTAAVNAMLAVLNDSASHARLRRNMTTTNAPIAISESTSDPLQLDKDTLVITPRLAVSRHMQSATALAAQTVRVRRMLARSRWITLDLRADSSLHAAEAKSHESFLRHIMPTLLDRNLVLPVHRYRVHSGYAPQNGSTSGDYYSKLVTGKRSAISGKSRIKTPPILILANANTTSLPVIIALQSAGLAYVVQEGGTPSAAAIATIDLGEGIELALSTTEWVDDMNAVVVFHADETIIAGDAPPSMQPMIAREKLPVRRNNAQPLGAPVNGKDRPYQEMPFPSYEYRLLALFRYWGAIQYFFPYKSLIGDGWNTVLTRFVPKFEENNSSHDYELTVRSLSTEIHDTHGFVGPTQNLDERIGTFIPSVAVRNIEDQVVITSVLDNEAELHVGDTIISVDGKPVSELMAFFSGLHSSSKPNTSPFMTSLLLRGQKDSKARLMIREANGKTREINVRRNLEFRSEKNLSTLERKAPTVEIFPNGLGYVDLDRLQKIDVPRMFKSIENTCAIIFDMRGYPNGTAWDIAPRLSTARNPVAARFSRPHLDGAALAGTSLDAIDAVKNSYEFKQQLPDPAGKRYMGQIVMLIDESSISQSEHTALFFEAATDITFIGTATAGANGDVTNIVLPGGIYASFSGHDVRHADGRQLQRVGIQPTIQVAPTIAGLISGRDEVLDMAVAFLTRDQKNSSKFACRHQMPQ